MYHVNIMKKQKAKLRDSQQNNWLFFKNQGHENQRLKYCPRLRKTRYHSARSRPGPGPRKIRRDNWQNPSQVRGESYGPGVNSQVWWWQWGEETSLSRKYTQKYWGVRAFCLQRHLLEGPLSWGWWVWPGSRGTHLELPVPTPSPHHQEARQIQTLLGAGWAVRPENSGVSLGSCAFCTTVSIGS